MLEPERDLFHLFEHPLVRCGASTAFGAIVLNCLRFRVPTKLVPFTWDWQRNVIFVVTGQGKRQSTRRYCSSLAPRENNLHKS